MAVRVGGVSALCCNGHGFLIDPPGVAPCARAALLAASSYTNQREGGRSIARDVERVERWATISSSDVVAAAAAAANFFFFPPPLYSVVVNWKTNR